MAYIIKVISTIEEILKTKQAFKASKWEYLIKYPKES